MRRNTVYKTVSTSVVDPHPKADEHPERLILRNAPQSGQSHDLRFASRAFLNLYPVTGH
jgi:hypothetical protein